MKHSGPRNKALHESTSTIPVSLEAVPRRSRARRGFAHSASTRRAIGIFVGGCLAVLAVGVLLLPGKEHLSAPGTMNAGHEQLGCVSCHRPAPGTVRQQLQANARYLLGWRQTPVDFGLRAVGNDDCLACHERPFDRHPAFRFTEPRFSEARLALGPHRCESCHREHSGARVTVRADYCVQCHGTLEVKKDPLDVPHAELVRRGSWLTCLGCHDFHGNHVMETPTRVKDAIAPHFIQQYFQKGPSPYPRALRRTSRQQRADRDE